jgi:hypothetical protein
MVAAVRGSRTRAHSSACGDASTCIGPYRVPGVASAVDASAFASFAGQVERRTMSADTNVADVRACIERAWNQGDTMAFDEFISPDFVGGRERFKGMILGWRALCRS